jgi:formylglycine-generating enzyme required for sulfatase activity/regulation of enolase protein 1 (concanavalin A-like superfamily)
MMLVLVPTLIEAQPAAPCPQSGPLSEAQLTELLKGSVAAPRIRQLVVSCGIDFEPDGGAIGRLRAAGAPQTVLDALRAATGPAERKRQAEQALWESIKDSQDPATFEDYLRRYPEGQFASPARQRYLDLKVAGTSERRFRDDFDRKLEPGWQWIDPAGDSIMSLDAREGFLRITVTGYHDLWSRNFNAPRLVREADGDFTVETKLAGPGRWCGGILVWKDSSNHIRFERGPHFRNELNLQGISGGRPWVAARDYVEGDPTWLRLERKGSTFRATYSIDGKEWRAFKRILASDRSDGLPRISAPGEDPYSVLKEDDFKFKPSTSSAAEMRISETLLVGVSGIVPAERIKQTVTDYDYIEITESAPLRAVAIPPATIVAGRTKVNPKDGLTYVWIPPGTFMMGCSPGDNGCQSYEKPAHEVTITKGFWLGQTPVTQQAYQRVTGRSPSSFKGATLPVEMVNWDEAQAYCAVIGGRLPTEAEWEYAARAGSTAARYGNLDEIAWYPGPAGSKTHEVARKAPNAWGLYDMLGNVWQWTADWFGDYQSGAQSDPSGSTSGHSRAMRGGSWGSGGPFFARFSVRGAVPGSQGHAVGLRCVGE